MKRAPIVAAATVAGLAGVLGFHTNSGASPATAITPTTTTPGQASPAPVTSGPATSGPATTTGPATTAAVAASATGKYVNYSYGALAVKVTVNGQKIADVSVARIQTLEQYSQSLAQQVIPMLRSEVLAAQSAQINSISGASYTSEAYAMSLQSALDKLHVK